MRINVKKLNEDLKNLCELHKIGNISIEKLELKECVLNAIKHHYRYYNKDVLDPIILNIESGKYDINVSNIIDELLTYDGVIKELENEVECLKKIKFEKLEILEESGIKKYRLEDGREFKIITEDAYNKCCKSYIISYKASYKVVDDE